MGHREPDCSWVRTPSIPPDLITHGRSTMARRWQSAGLLTRSHVGDPGREEQRMDEIADTQRQIAPGYPNRWHIAAAAALMQGAVGATYAWSVFRDPLVAQFGWTIPEVTLAYSLNLFGLGIFTFIGGLWMRRVGPRTVGLVAGLL